MAELLDETDTADEVQLEVDAEADVLLLLLWHRLLDRDSEGVMLQDVEKDTEPQELELLDRETVLLVVDPVEDVLIVVVFRFPQKHGSQHTGAQDVLPMALSLPNRNWCVPSAVVSA